MINLANLKYDEKLDLYQYPVDANNSIYPRDENQHVIGSHNIGSFYTQLEEVEFEYDFTKSIEQDDFLKFIDHQLSRSYSEINQLIISNEFDAALTEINRLEVLYPDITRFSDLLFLKAIAYEHSGSIEQAHASYLDFLNYSSAKYSRRFRGYRDFDRNDSIWALERSFAKEKYFDSTKADYSKFLSVIEPKYHYSSFQPGFLINPEDYSRGIDWISMFVFGYDYSNKIGIAYHVSRKLNSRFDMNVWAMSSGNTSSFGAGVPIQIYKSSDNRFAAKISPFVSFAYTDTILVDDATYGIRQGLFNFGAKLSGAFYLLPNLSLGAYYKYNFHNANHPILTKKHNLSLWWQNEYDLSMYYAILKGLSVKAGVYNGDLVGGILWSGWEISYNITNPGLLLRIDMY
ncbi:hypothetical protein [Roseimarinus sediminis]|uniref:hypothetical protein n=1 Tax=Roseimarinus sediminis TaxID=1610899 RepID=UPI003D1D2DD8